MEASYNFFKNLYIHSIKQNNNRIRYFIEQFLYRSFPFTLKATK